MRALYVGLFSVICLTAGYVLFLGNISSGVLVEPQVLGASSSQVNTEQQEFISKINQIRSSAGAKELIYSENNENITKYRVQDMVDRDYYSHKTPDGATYASYFKDYGIETRFSCENLQLQGGSDINKAIKSWVDSSAHFECLTDSRLNQISFSYVLYDSIASNDNLSQDVYVFAMIATQ